MRISTTPECTKIDLVFRIFSFYFPSHPDFTNFSKTNAVKDKSKNFEFEKLYITSEKRQNDIILFTYLYSNYYILQTVPNRLYE